MRATKSLLGSPLLVGAIATAVPLVILLGSHGARAQDPGQSEIQIGFAISPVPLDLRGKNRALVGLGSYIVNAQAGCNECHVGSTPNNLGLYLAGGSDGPNLTPDGNGLPGGLTLQQFFNVMRNGVDPEGNPVEEPMPVRVYKNMTDRDLTAIYEFLRSIPTQPQPGP